MRQFRAKFYFKQYLVDDIRIVASDFEQAEIVCAGRKRDIGADYHDLQFERAYAFDLPKGRTTMILDGAPITPMLPRR